MSRTIFRIQDLPLELEREIFETAARNERGSALRLVLVAKRVYLWIRPYIYNTLTVGLDDSESFLETQTSNDSKFLSRHVRRLCLAFGVPARSASRILSSCRGVRSLACWVDFLDDDDEGVGDGLLLRDLINPLRLDRLSIEFVNFLYLFPTPDSPWCANLTHLTLVFWTFAVDHGAFSVLSTLPSLTHLCLRGKVVSCAVPCILRTCKRLQVLLVIHGDEDEWDDEDDTSFVVEEDDLEEPDDVRFVTLPHENVVLDWEAPSHGLPDSWERAENIIRERREERERRRKRCGSSVSSLAKRARSTSRIDTADVLQERNLNTIQPFNTLLPQLIRKDIEVR